MRGERVCIFILGAVIVLAAAQPVAAAVGEGMVASGTATIQDGRVELVSGESFAAGGLTTTNLVREFDLRMDLALERPDGRGYLVFGAGNLSAVGRSRESGRKVWENFPDGYFLQLHEDFGYRLVERRNGDDTVLAVGPRGFTGGEGANVISGGRHRFRAVVDRINASHASVELWRGNRSLIAYTGPVNATGHVGVYWRAGAIPVSASLTALDIERPGTEDDQVRETPGDSDGILETPPGGLPSNHTLARAVINRSHERNLSGEKTALVASEYLYRDWPMVLGTLGGGMWTGKSIEGSLEARGVEVDRAVEHRAEPERFLQDLTPVELRAVLRMSEDIEAVLSPVVGSGAATALAKGWAGVVGLTYVERGLRQYLEHDWSTFGLDTARAEERLSDRDRRSLRDAAVAAGRDVYRGRKSLVDVLREEGVQESLATAVHGYFWPDRYDRLTREKLRAGMRDSDIVAYLGRGNATAWHLPDRGSNATYPARFGREHVPEMDGAVVFDGSSRSTANVSGALWRGFLRKGATAVVGPASESYRPYTGEIAATFFDEGYTVGEGLRLALNELRRAGLLLDHRDLLGSGRRETMLSSFRIWGDPGTPKDPSIEEPPFERTVSCDAGRCTLQVEFEFAPRVADVDRRAIAANATTALITDGRPVVPVSELTHALPADAEVVGHEVDRDRRQVENVSVPRAPGEASAEGWFPRNVSAVNVRTAGNRTVIDIVHAAYRVSDGRAQVYENVSVAVHYRTPLEFSVSAANGAPGNATVAFDVRNRGEAVNATVDLRLLTPVRPYPHQIRRRIPSGRSTFTVEVPTYGSGMRAVEAVIHANGSTVGPRRDRFSARRRPVRLTVAAPERATVPDPFTATVTAENPSAAPRSVTVAINGSDAIQAGFLQERTHRVHLPPNGSRRWTVRLRPVTAGDARVAAEGQQAHASDSIEVRRPSAVERAVDGLKQFLGAGGRTARLTAERTPRGRAIGFASSRGEVEVRRREGNATTVLRTPDWEIRRHRGPGMESTEYVDGGERWTRVERDGTVRTIRTGDIRDGEVRRAIRWLREERRKLLRWTSQSGRR